MHFSPLLLLNFLTAIFSPVTKFMKAYRGWFSGSPDPSSLQQEFHWSSCKTQGFLSAYISYPSLFLATILIRIFMDYYVYTMWGRRTFDYIFSYFLSCRYVYGLWFESSWNILQPVLYWSALLLSAYNWKMSHVLVFFGFLFSSPFFFSFFLHFFLMCCFFRSQEISLSGNLKIFLKP